ncbi:gem-associated protein 6-like [Glandiceps talaboti]
MSATIEDARPSLLSGHTTPAEWFSLVYKQIQVESVDGKLHVGWVQTIDPVSQSIVLVQFTDSGCATAEVILGHAISSVRLLNEEIETHRQQLDQLFSRNSHITYTEEELIRRKTELKEWLEKNRIPVSESGSNEELLTVSEALYIEPPYKPENCVSTNEIILGRIQALIRSKPGSLCT